ncbi:coniferyl aldehyde dehydrogenase [Pseudomonas japonica]|uniref:coniferyl aldehyde dehydrogenase n=1 Tax=Pseudomonas japonica TaxID=256466 RepID=UPI0037FAACFB
MQFDPTLGADQYTPMLEQALALQRGAYLAHPTPSLAERREDLRTLVRLVRDNKDALVRAILQDFGSRSSHETLLAEVFPAIDSALEAIRHLRKWMRPQRRKVDSRLFFGARNLVTPQPLGVVGVIVPWNFPLHLSLVPLVSIFAAGNRAMVKMSENSRHLAALLIELTPQYFLPEKLRFFDETGGVGIAFSKLKFDHLLFTGSSQTGRAVMAAAAQNLVPVTLELGGKAPAIVCDDYPMKKAAQRILFAKLLSAGQICITVDHVWLPRKRIHEFVELARAIVAERFGSIESPDYTSIIDRRAFNRLVEAIEEAREAGATVVPLLPGNAIDDIARKITPHIVYDLPPDCALARREIFGPILPLRPYDDLEQVVGEINAGDRPLAIYPFSRDRDRVQMLIERTMSGGVSVNETLFHVAQHDMPFGGIGESGMGHYHGREGFTTFSKLRPVFYQAPISGLHFLSPPYGRFADLLLRFLIR